MQYLTECTYLHTTIDCRSLENMHKGLKISVRESSSSCCFHGGKTQSHRGLESKSASLDIETGPAFKEHLPVQKGRWERRQLGRKISFTWLQWQRGGIIERSCQCYSISSCTINQSSEERDEKRHWFSQIFSNYDSAWIYNSAEAVKWVNQVISCNVDV